MNGSSTSLRQLRMTRISVAHRPDMASGADRIVRVFRTAQSITDSRQLRLETIAPLSDDPIVKLPAVAA